MNGRNPQWRLSKTPALSLALPARVFIEVRQRGSHKPFVSCVCGRTMDDRNVFIEPPYAVPYAQWCGRGKIPRASPIPVRF